MDAPQLERDAGGRHESGLVTLAESRPAQRLAHVTPGVSHAPPHGSEAGARAPVPVPSPLHPSDPGQRPLVAPSPSGGHPPGAEGPDVLGAPRLYHPQSRGLKCAEPEGDPEERLSPVTLRAPGGRREGRIPRLAITVPTWNITSPLKSAIAGQGSTCGTRAPPPPAPWAVAGDFWQLLPADLG